jgi:hypothetical protein
VTFYPYWIGTLASAKNTLIPSYIFKKLCPSVVKILVTSRLKNISNFLMEVDILIENFEPKAFVNTKLLFYFIVFTFTHIYIHCLGHSLHPLTSQQNMFHPLVL